jgi:alcohol dehydrogenase (cytochrome c)
VLESPNKFTPLSSTPVTIYPGVNGGNTWSPPAYSPLTRYVYVPAANQAWTYTSREIPPYKPGDAVQGQRLGGTARAEFDSTTPGAIRVTGSLSAIDVNTGRIAWQYKSELPMVGGALATGGNLVFHGEATGDLDAFDAKTGRKLWSYHLGAGVSAPPITYRVKGVQYVAVGAGGLGALGARAATNIGLQPSGDVVAIFALPD